MWTCQPRHVTERLSDSFCKQYNACRPPLFPRQEKDISLHAVHGVKCLSIFSNVIKAAVVWNLNSKYIFSKSLRVQLHFCHRYRYSITTRAANMPCTEILLGEQQRYLADEWKMFKNRCLHDDM